MFVRLLRHASVVSSLRSMPIMAKPSGSLPPLTRLWSAGTTRRLVRSPAAPKITMVAGAGRRPGKLFPIVAAASAASLGLLPLPGVAPLRRDDGPLPSRSMPALRDNFLVEALGYGLA